MVNYMSYAPSEQSHLVTIDLTTWDQLSTQFKDRTALIGNQETADHIEQLLGRYRLTIAASSPIDLATLKNECLQIFANHLPPFKMPPIDLLLMGFFGVLLLASVTSFVVGLALMAQAYIASLIGIMTIASFNFGSLATTAVTLGTVAASVVTCSMFSPVVVNTFAIDTFINEVQKSPTPV